MSWKDLLQADDESIVAAYLGGTEIYSGSRTWTMFPGTRPAGHGWFRFVLNGRRCTCTKPADPPTDGWLTTVSGFMVGDHLLPDSARIPFGAPLSALYTAAKRVELLEPGLERFARVTAGTRWPQGPLLFQSLAFPLGPENDVLQAFQDGKATVEAIPGVTPALDLAFRLASWQRDETARIRKEERERREREERLREIREKLGDGEKRRNLAKIDFGEAAKAALAVGGATYLDHRASANKGEFVVWFRFEQRRFEVVCNGDLRIVDAGICLVDHRTNEKGDTRFTLESFPAVLRQAMREHKLVVWRHADPDHRDDDWNDREDDFDD